jgi:hypothetical protein
VTVEFPDAPYLYREDEPLAGPGRPLSQGDVFADIPLVGPAQPNPKQPGSWVAPKPRTGPKALGLFVTHPCASRSSTTYALAPFVSIAPVVKRPKNWAPPWDGWYEYFPLPKLRDGEDYVAKLGEVCPVPSGALDGRRIACLGGRGLEALFHRLAMNSLRFPETPSHYRMEAARLTNEMRLWEQWTVARNTEAGFQEWLDKPFGGQAHEDADGEPIPGSAKPSGESRRAVLVWNYEELAAELATELA